MHDDKRKLFRRGGVDSFIMSHKRYFVEKLFLRKFKNKFLYILSAVWVI